MNFSSAAKLRKRVGSCSGIVVNLMSGGAGGPCHSYSTTAVILMPRCCDGEARVGGLNCTEGRIVRCVVHRLLHANSDVS